MSRQRVGGWDVDGCCFLEKYCLLFPFFVIIVCWWMVEALGAIVKDSWGPFLCWSVFRKQFGTFADRRRSTFSNPSLDHEPPLSNKAQGFFKFWRFARTFDAAKKYQEEFYKGLNLATCSKHCMRCMPHILQIMKSKCCGGQLSVEVASGFPFSKADPLSPSLFCRKDNAIDIIDHASFWPVQIRCSRNLDGSQKL